MKTLIKFENNSTDFTPLMLIVTGSAGCGKSYLIKCLVKAVKMFYNSNKGDHSFSKSSSVFFKLSKKLSPKLSGY
jgi:predicted ATPase